MYIPVESYGYGVLYHTKSSKQKMIIKSLTESELVDVSDYTPFHIWLVNFPKHQAYRIEKISKIIKVFWSWK